MCVNWKSRFFLNLRNMRELKFPNSQSERKVNDCTELWIWWLLGREIKTVNVHHYSSSISYFHFEHIFITIIIIAVTMISVVMMISVVTTMISATYFLVVRGRTYSCCSRHLGWKPCRREYFVAIISIILMILVIILMKLESCENFYSDEISLTYFFVDVKSREIEIAPFYETGRNVNHKFPLGFLLECEYVYTFKQSSLRRSWKWHKLKKAHCSIWMYLELWHLQVMLEPPAGTFGTFDISWCTVLYCQVYNGHACPL